MRKTDLGWKPVEETGGYVIPTTTIDGKTTKSLHNTYNVSRRTFSAESRFQFQNFKLSKASVTAGPATYTPKDNRR